MRRRFLVLGLLAALGASAAVNGEEGPPPGSVEPKAQTTIVEGTVPDLEGRWLLLASLGVAQGAKRIVPSALDVRRSDGKLEIRERHVVLPPAQNEALRRGNEELGGVWTPTDADLAAIGAAWESLQIEDRGIATMTHILTGRDAYGDDLKNDAMTKDAAWVLRQTYAFEPGGNRPTTQANILATLDSSGGRYSGKYLAVAVAAAPFPVPIKFEGTFVMIPVGHARPWWARIADVFSGCNGR